MTDGLIYVCLFTRYLALAHSENIHIIYVQNVLPIYNIDLFYYSWKHVIILVFPKVALQGGIVLLYLNYAWNVLYGPVFSVLFPFAKFFIIPEMKTVINFQKIITQEVFLYVVFSPYFPQMSLCRCIYIYIYIYSL